MGRTHIPHLILGISAINGTSTPNQPEMAKLCSEISDVGPKYWQLIEVRSPHRPKSADTDAISCHITAKKRLVSRFCTESGCRINSFVERLSSAESGENARHWLGRFIVATNILDEARLPDLSLLNCYKEQSSSVERGFRFLKDPMFFADSLFLKSPARIMAMIMIMGLALLIYALAERQLRQQLTASGETIPDQKGLPTQTPTMRRVAQIFEGIDILTIRLDDQIVERRVLNLSPIRTIIIRLFGPHVQNSYLLQT